MRSAALENHDSVVLLDKSYLCDGNTTKATNGINDANTKIQCEKNNKESIETSTSDPLQGDTEKPELVKVLRAISGFDVEWLIDAFILDSSLFARRGGQSTPWTHRGKERFPGMTITYALTQMVEKNAEWTNKALVDQFAWSSAQENRVFHRENHDRRHWH